MPIRRVCKIPRARTAENPYRWADNLCARREGIISWNMKKSVETLLESFERLPEDAKREAAAEILKRSAKFKLPPLGDDALLQAADSLFLKLDKEDSKHG